MTANHKFIIRLQKEQIIKNIYHVGDNGCSVYMIDHIAICAELSRELPDIKFYAHESDAVPIEAPDHDGLT